jgi:uroporphyrinogen decarboxylase
MLPELMKDNPKKNPVFLAVLQRGIDLKMAFPEMGIAMPVAGPFTNASLIRPVEMILRDTVRNPDKLNDLLKWTVDYTVAYAEMFADEFGGGGCTICDPISCADILGKRNYKKFSHPWLEYLIEGLTQTRGKKPGIHICGKTSPLWDEMLKLKVSSFSVDNMENLADARDKMGPVFGLVGNVAPVDVMLNGTIDDVIETCKQCIINGSEAENGYTLGTGCQVPIGTSRENFDAFIFAARKYGRGARKGMLPLGIVEEAANDVVMNKA